MDKIIKALKQLRPKEEIQVRLLLEKILQGNFSNTDIVKLKGREDIYRVRQGKIRIIFYKNNKTIKILTIERRSDTTYNI